MITATKNLIKVLPESLIAGFLMIISGISISLMTALVRYASAEMHPFEIAFFRSFLVLPLLTPIIFRTGLKIFKTSNPKFQIIRALAGSAAILCFFYGLSITELAKTQALGLTVPVFSTLLAIFFLGEVVGIKRWSAMLMGFIGAIIIMRPDVSIGIGPIVILCACFFWSSSVLIAKVLTRTDSNLTITLWSAIGIIPATFILSLGVWKWPSSEQLLILFIITIFGTIAQFTLVAALKRGNVSFILPLDYLKLLWAVMLGFYFFGEIPNSSIWFGGILIIFSTTYITSREAIIEKSKKHP